MATTTRKIGRQINILGYVKEDTRNEAEETATVFFPLTSLEIYPKMDYFENRDAMGRPEDLICEISDKTYVEGTAAGVLDVKYIGYWLHHIYGTETSVTALGATTHTFSNAENSVDLDTWTSQFLDTDGNRKVNGNIANSLTINIGRAESSYELGFLGLLESAGDAQTQTVVKDCQILLGKHNTPKFADTVAGLASGTEFKEIKSFNITYNRNASFDDGMGSLEAYDTISGKFDAEISFDVTMAKDDWKTRFQNNTQTAFEFDFNAPELAALGTSTLHPRLKITVPPSTIKAELTRDNDVVVSATITVLASLTTAGNGYIVETLLQNEVTAY